MMKTFDLQFFGEAPTGSGASVTTNTGAPDGGAAPSNTVTSPTQVPPTDGGNTPTTPPSPVTTPPLPPATPPIAGEAKKGVPESYQPFTLPASMPADDPQIQTALTEAGAVFKELGLTQEQGQKLIDLHSKHWLGGMLNQQELFEEELTRRINGWGEQTKAHPEFGGARLNESVASVKRAVGGLGGNALEKALNETGAINHPEIFAAFARAGKLFAEDRFVSGGAPGASAPNSPAAMAARVYPGMTRT